MNKYLIIIEKTDTGYSAYSPDVEGCIAVGTKEKECEQNMRQAIKFHIELMVEKGYDVPLSSAKSAQFIDVPLSLPV